MGGHASVKSHGIGRITPCIIEYPQLGLSRRTDPNGFHIIACTHCLGLRPLHGTQPPPVHKISKLHLVSRLPDHMDGYPYYISLPMLCDLGVNNLTTPS